MTTHDTFPRTLDDLRAFVEPRIHKALEAEKDRTPISDRPAYPLDVELMEFRFMPDTREVSLIRPQSAFYEQARIINLSPRTALNLLAWLDVHRETLEALADAPRHAIAPPTLRNHGVFADDVPPSRLEELPAWARQEETGAQHV